MTLKIRTFAFASLAAAALAATAMSPAFAETATSQPADQAASASHTGAANPLLQISNDGYNVLRDIRAARIAIFNGDTAAALKYADQAKVDMASARADDTAAVKKGTDKQYGDWLAIDGQLVVSDDFEMTPEKAASIQKSNAALKKGDTKTAVEALKDAQISVGFTRVLMPLKQTSKHIDTALNLIDAHQYYQANLALKAAEDGLGMDTVMLFDPATASNTATKAKS